MLMVGWPLFSYTQDLCDLTGVSIHPNLVSTQDTTICQGATKQLRTSPTSRFCWSPTTYLNDPSSPNPVTSSPVNITYYFTAEVQGNNVIGNGNFSAGNTGFTSGYTYAFPNTTESEYHVSANPQAWNNSLTDCNDHTTGNGSMMMINGSPVADVEIWKQTVTVVPNTNYSFSTWIQTLFAQNPAVLRFSINGQEIGNDINAEASPCIWNLFATTWNSGNNTSAVISIVNKNTLVAGNDFALDDIAFVPVLIQRDSVVITVATAAVKAREDTLLCKQTTLQLNATGALSYIWTPATGLSNANIPNPVAMPTTTTRYIVAGTTMNGCIGRDTVVITMESADVRTRSDTVICKTSPVQLQATGAKTYAWTPATGLSNANIANPIAMPTGTTTYIVIGRTTHGCEARDSVVIQVASAAVQAINDTVICDDSPVQLNATGALNYSWTPATGLSNANIANPIAMPASTTTYIVRGMTDHGCEARDSVTIVKEMTPQVTITPDTIVCMNTPVQLQASGGIKYAWTPATGLDDPASAHPAVMATRNMIYTVTVSNDHCAVKDSVQIDVRPYPVFSAVSGQAICNGASVTLNASGGDHYTWSPAASLDNPVIASPLATPGRTTVYSVYISENNCGVDTTINVKINVTNDPAALAMSNAFTPNGDGKNDCFGIKSLNNAVVRQFAVYNRWGQIIFETKDPLKCWDGTFNGIPQESGGYAYVTKVNTPCGFISKSGIVTLIR